MTDIKPPEFENKLTFCEHCRKEVRYVLAKYGRTKKVIKGESFLFTFTAAYCPICGHEVGVKGLLDYKTKEIEAQYRTLKGA